MAFLQYYTGRLKLGCTEALFGDTVDNWGSYVKKHKDVLFPELTSTRYFKRCNEEAEFDGFYVIIAEYQTVDSFKKYEKRKTIHKDGSLDPRALLEPQSVVVTHLKPQRETMWFDYTKEKQSAEQEAGIENTRYLEYEYWKLADGVDKIRYQDIIDTWFIYVAEHKQKLFAEWISARYYEQTDENGNSAQWYAMIFEYASHDQFQTYKKRRRHSYDTNTGDYLVYRDNDPYQFFNQGSVATDGLWPYKESAWFSPNKS